MAIERNITPDDMFFLGEAKILPGIVYQADGVTPQDITSWALKFVLAYAAGGVATLTKSNGVGGGLTITLAASGEYEIEFDAADTASLKYEFAYDYSVMRTDPGYETVLTVGTLEFRRATQ